MQIRIWLCFHLKLSNYVIMCLIYFIWKVYIKKNILKIPFLAWNIDLNFKFIFQKQVWIDAEADVATF